MKWELSFLSHSQSSFMWSSWWFCIIYLDNILIFSKSEEEHYQHLQLIIECLWYTKLYANFKKYKFFKSEVKYFDFLINKNDLHMNLSHVQTISDWCNHSFKIFCNIQIFIEFCNFYQQFIFNFTSIAWLLHLLLHDMKRDRKLSLIADKWQILQQETFKQLIDAFISASVLCHYNSQCKL